MPEGSSFPGAGIKSLDALAPRSNRALLIFTRNPEPGKCKTRLAATIGDRAALEIYDFLLRHTAALSKSLRGADKYVYFSEHLGDGSLWDPACFKHRLQEGTNLGERMEHALEETFAAGYTRAVLIGSDLYDLTTGDLEQAFRQLDRHQAVLGPAGDGGYYLIGLRQLHPGLFQNKQWGTQTVLEDTLADLRKTDTCLLPVRNDVDRYEDIQGNPVFEPFLKPDEK